jgi:hypothetical protein
MLTKTFLSTVLADGGEYCIVGINNGATRQKFVADVDEAVAVVDQLDRRGVDVYTALATFNSASRKVADIKSLKSFFMDLDCGEGKGFEDQSDALTRLRAFCAAANLPKPTVMVNSGRGLHVYWVLDFAIDYLEWAPIANALKRACITHNFPADPVVTADGARILRVPGTRNFKTDPPMFVAIIGHINETYPLHRFSSVLKREPLPALTLPESSREMSDEDRATMNNLLGNYTKKFSKILIKTMEGKGCAQIDSAVRAPASLGYPQWVDVISIAKHCEEGNVAVHNISKAHPDYDPVETDKVANSIRYPHLCSTFEVNNPAGCAGCPLKGKIKSPISLGMEVKEATEQDNIVHVPVEKPVSMELSAPAADGLFEPASEEEELQTYVIPPYPYPYFRGANGGIYLRQKNKDGEEEELEVYHRDIYPVKRIRDPVSGASTLLRYHTKLEGVREFVVPNTKLFSREDCRRELSFNGIVTLNPEMLLKYFTAWVKRMESVEKEEDAVSQFGWTPGKDAFVVGSRKIKVRSIEDNPPSPFTQAYFPALEPKGKLSEWVKATEFLNRPGFEPHQFMLGLSFGSPLMIFAPAINGAIFNLYSGKSGFGKSQAQFLGASVWGNHSGLVLKGTSDTENMIWNRAEVYKNLPLYAEEVTNFTSEMASGFLYKSGEGTQKGRMSNAGQNRERYRGSPWQLLVGLSSNATLGGKVSQKKASPQGELQRIIEIEIFKLLDDSAESNRQAREFNELYQNNYGVACVPYIQKLLSNMVAAKKLVDTMSDKLVEAAGLGPQNRGWVAQAATTLAGLLIAKTIKLHNFDMDALFAWTVKTLKDKKVEAAQYNVKVEDLVANYIAENIRGVLRIKSTTDARGINDPSGADVMSVPDATPMYRWVARHEYDQNRLFLLLNPFKKWLAQQQLDYNEMETLIFKEMNGKKEKVRLGKGTRLNIPPSYAIVLTWADNAVDEIPKGSVFDA